MQQRVGKDGDANQFHALFERDHDAGAEIAIRAAAKPASGLGEARNALVVRVADVVIAVSGEFGTLSEIALALKMGKPVVGLSTWQLAKQGKEVDAVIVATSPADAVRLALRAAAE